MKRPTLSGAGTSALDDCCSAGEAPRHDNRHDNRHDSRLSRVRQALSNSLLLGRRGRVFGVRLEELSLGKDGVPAVVSRLCGFIQLHGLHCGGLFRLSCGNQKLVEHLRLSFDRTGDADLESVADVASVASLLKLWIRELPEPIIMSEVAAELLQIQESYTENSTEWQEAVCQAIMTLPEKNIRLLCYLLRFLHNYNLHSPHPKCHHRMSGGGVAAVFSTLLILQAIEWKGTIRSIQHLRLSNQFMSRFISQANNICKEIFGVYSVAHHEASQALCIHYRSGGDGADSLLDECPVGAKATGLSMHSSQRKRKDCQEPLSLDSHERKVIRSNSEERRMEGDAGSKDMRRVSSHEDFALVKGGTRKHMNKHEPLHERNANTSDAVAHSAHTAAANDNMWEEISDDEHERRRSTERFARSVVRRGRRNVSRSRRVFHAKTSSESKEGSSSKENEAVKERLCQQVPEISVGGILQQSLDSFKKSQQERDRSPSPSPTPCTPPLDLRILHQQVDCTEPLTSHGSWSCQPEDEFPTSHVILSPRNSMILTRRVAMDPNVPPSPPQEHNVPVPVSGILASQTRMKHLSKQMTNIKKKLKRYEEEFESKHGCRPPHSVKMDNNEVKKLYAEISKIHKEMTVIKEESETSLMETNSKHGQSQVLSTYYLKHSRIENLVLDVQKYLKDKRDGAGRPEALREMSLDQMREEKVNMQKALFSLENMVGRAESHEHKLMVRPLYNRYRMLKQLIIRFEQFKLKGSVPELETILEHEAMAFTPQSQSCEVNQLQEDVKDPSVTTADVAASPVQKEHSEQDADDADNETLWNNLHTLPLSELLDQQRNTRAEKKALRRLLREQEQQLLQQSGKKVVHEDLSTVENTRNLYKKAKCKLRLLDALVSKQS